MKDGILIGFSTPNSWHPISWLVRTFMGSKMSHTFLVYYDDDLERQMVMEAHESGFRLIPWEKFLNKNKIVMLVDPMWDMSDAIKFLANYINTAYDFAGLFGSIFVVLGSWFKKKWKNPVQSARSMFCSEANVRAMQYVNHPDTIFLIPDDTTPKMLCDVLLAGRCRHVADVE